MAYGESNGQVTNDVKWSRDRWRHVTPKGQLVTSIRLEPNISKTAGDANCQLLDAVRQYGWHS